VSKYEDYAQAERDEGREPLEMPQWRAQRMRESQQTKAEPQPVNPDGSPIPAPPDSMPDEPRPGSPSDVPDLPDSMTFFCENRFRVEVMQAGHKTVIGGVVVPVAHRTIEFNEHHWTADMAVTDHREKVEWLLSSPAYKKGEIVLVPEARPTNRVQVRTGPRTTSTPRLERIERPAGALSARLDP
jgi:hypothetical protein